MVSLPPEAARHSTCSGDPSPLCALLSCLEGQSRHTDHTESAQQGPRCPDAPHPKHHPQCPFNKCGFHSAGPRTGHHSPHGRQCRSGRIVVSPETRALFQNSAGCYGSFSSRCLMTHGISSTRPDCLLWALQRSRACCSSLSS